MDILSARVVASEDHVSSTLDGEEVILNLKNGTYYGLNEVGARVWKLVQEEVAVTEVRDQLLAEYDAEAEQVEQDLVGLLNDLKAAELVEIKPG